MRYQMRSVLTQFWGITWVSCLCLTACQPSQKPAASNNSSSASTVNHTTGVQSPSVTQASAVTNASNTSKSNTPKAINWALIDSGVRPVDKEKFNYPFALDGVQVKAYMDAYHVDAKTARYNLTTGMAVNEVLSKVLDQVNTDYTSHELTAGEDSQFIIHTTKNIEPSEYRYVFAEPFAKGLSIPVKIVNDGKK